ncbi:SpoIIE family protein phosphatase [Modestobacter marinus]|uniref:SpoIIE family protein phosphatase n=1 Tax=Modestobacter marinus TaxID=477641 RepID=UPI0021BC19E9|nr:SpoIIE family protein phosphatase [Modestobacter marinus]
MSEPLWVRRALPQLAPDAGLVGRWRPGRAADVSASRRQLAAAMQDGDRPMAASDEAVERLLLAFEELVSNAVRHARPPVEATVTATDRFWLLQVTDDAGEEPPSPAVDRDAALGGLGLGMVAAICGAVGWEPLEAGRKVVWARLDFTGDEALGSVPRPRDGATDPPPARAIGPTVSTPQHPAPAPAAAAAPALSAAPAATHDAVPATAGVVGEIAASRLGAGVLAAALAALPDGVAIFDREWTIDYVNPVGAALLGRPAGELVGRNIWVALPELGGTILHDFLLHARGVGEPVTWAGFYPPAGRWLSVTAGTLGGLLQMTFRATDDRPDEPVAAGTGPERAATDTEADRDRLRFLAEVSESLIATLDTGASASRLAELTARRFCDWAIVALVGEDGRDNEDSWAHRDPGRAADLDTYMRGRLRGTGDDTVLVNALLTGEPIQVPTINQEQVAPSLPTEQVREAWQRLNLTSCSIVPLRARGETFGVLALMNADGQPLQTELELATAVEVARRGALALDNARLYGRQLKVAETLQHSLLTPPPQPDRLQICVRYRPAASHQQVGGDWYDAFTQPDGATMLVIGDVVGHNVDAAAAMGQIRSILRGIAYDRPESPAQILRRVDAALAGLHVDTLATALIARIEQTPQHEAAEQRLLRWSSAGHLPPLLLHADGTVQLLDSPPERLLGTGTTSPRNDHQALVCPGDTVLFYTDGLVETGRTAIDEGIARLATELALLRAVPVDELCDRLLARIAPGRTDDDIAVLALHAGTDG